MSTLKRWNSTLNSGSGGWEYISGLPAILNESSITFTDITTGNATTSAHGFLPKLPGGTTTFLRADGTWATVGSSFASPVFTGTATIPSENIGFQIITTTGGNTTFTSSSPTYTKFSGSQSQTLILPDATTLTAGRQIRVDNDSTQPVSVKTNGGTDVWTIAPGCDLYMTCTSIATSAGTWEYDYSSSKATSGKSLTINNTLTLAGTDGTTQTFPSTSKTIAANDGSNLTIASQAVGDILYASSTTAYTRLASSVPTATFINLLGFANGDTTPSYKALFDATVPSTQAFGDTASVGSATTAARRDHKHAMPSAYSLPTASSSILGGIKIGTGLSIDGSGVVTTAGLAKDANQNISVNNFIEGYSTTVTSSTPVTLTVASAFNQYFTGSTTQTVVLPLTTTLVNGQQFNIVNSSTALLTINSNGGTTILTIAPAGSVLFTCINISADASTSWTSLVSGGNSFYNCGAQATTYTVNLLNGTTQSIDMTGGVAITLSNPTVGKPQVLILYHDTSVRSYSFTNTIKWKNSTAATVAGKYDFVTLIWDGTSYYGDILPGF